MCNKCTAGWLFSGRYVSGAGQLQRLPDSAVHSHGAVPGQSVQHSDPLQQRGGRLPAGNGLQEQRGTLRVGYLSFLWILAMLMDAVSQRDNGERMEL